MSDKAGALARALAAVRRAAGGSEVVHTTPDGGRVVRDAQGNLSFSSPGYATSDPEAVARIMDGATPQREAQRTTDRLTIAQNPAAARVQEFNQGTPIVGEWLDEAVGTVAPRAAQAMRQTSDAMERENPGQSIGLNIAGGIATTAPLVAGAAGSRAADWVASGSTALTRGVRAGAVAAPLGAAEGAASMSGRAGTDRASAGATGAAVGAGLAGALGAFAPAIGEGAANLARRIKKLDVRVIADELGVSPKAARVVRGYLANDDLDAAAARMARSGDDAMLAEAGPATRQALDTAMSGGGEALRVGREAVEGRVARAGQRFAQQLDAILGTAEGGIKGRVSEITRRTAPARKAAYDRAYAQPVPTTGPAGQAIDDVLIRVAPEDFNAAMREANNEMRDAGIRNQNIMATIGDDGTVTFSQPPSVLQLDYLARGLGAVVDAGTDKVTGRMTPAARRASRQAKDLRDALKGAVPDYARALRLGGDTIRQTEAVTLGRRLLSASTTREDVLTALRGASRDVKEAAKVGLRENIDAVMSRARSTIADLEAGNFDFADGQNAAAEAVAAVRNLVNRDNFQKARIVMGTDAKRLFDELEKVGDALVLRAAVARNSQTAIRQAGQEQMREVVAPGLAQRALGDMGNPLEGMRDVTRSIMGTDAAAMSDAERQYFGEIARALTGIRGQEAQRALAAVQRAMAGQPLRDEEAALIGRLTGLNASSALYQTGEQVTAPRSP